MKLIFDIALVIFLAGLLLINAHNNFFIIASTIGVIPVIISALRALKNKELSIDLLASVAMVFAFIAGEWQSAAFVNLMLASARIFDEWTNNRQKQIISKMLKYRPEFVNVQIKDQIVSKPVSEINIGDVVLVELGERIPVDGIVIAGQSSVDESTLTGESESIIKKTGDEVFTSTLNQSGSLTIKVKRVGTDSRFAKIISLVEEASRAKSSSERIASKFVQWYILITLFGSIGLWFIFRDSRLVLSILLVVCADDIAVAVPLAFTAGIVRSAQRGILVKGSQVLEKLSRIKYFVTDKTGTLTMGKPEILDIKIVGKTKKEDIYEALASVTVNSSHPVSEAITAYMKDKRIDFHPAQSIQELPGEGMEANFKRKRIFVGKPEFIERQGIVISSEQLALIDKLRNSGIGISLVGCKELWAIVEFRDQIRPNAAQIILETRKMGVKDWTMLTGDNHKIAAMVSGELHLDHFESGVSPEEKLKFIRNFKNTHPNEEVAMIGDGVNDAASLALADVSIAMGLIGSDAAIEASDVAIIKDELNRIPEGMRLARQTLRVVKQNFTIWGITNAVGLVLVLTKVIGPEGAATFNFVTDFVPILNSLRMTFYRYEK